MSIRTFRLSCAVRFHPFIPSTRERSAGHQHARSHGGLVSRRSERRRRAVHGSYPSAARCRPCRCQCARPWPQCVATCNFFKRSAIGFGEVRSRPRSASGNDLTSKSADAMRFPLAKSSLPGSSKCHWLTSLRSWLELPDLPVLSICSRSPSMAPDDASSSSSFAINRLANALARANVIVD